MVDKRSRLTLTLTPGQQKSLDAIVNVTGKNESEVFHDALKFMYRDMIHTGEIQVPVDSDLVVRLARKIAVVMGNTDEDLELLDDATTIKTSNGNSAVNVRMT